MTGGRRKKEASKCCQTSKTVEGGNQKIKDEAGDKGIGSSENRVIRGGRDKEGPICYSSARGG